MKRYLSSSFICKFLVIFSNLFFWSLPGHVNGSGNITLSEHWTVGQKVKLRFNLLQTPEAAAPLHLKNGLTLSFGDILSLGTLYGEQGRPISHGITTQQKRARFQNAYKSFAHNIAAVDEVTALKSVIRTELHAIQSGMQRGETIEEIYKRIGNETGRQINCITGGGCANADWWLSPGRYMLLALEHYDHFSPNNIVVYKTGHQLALLQAVKARQSGNKIDLEQAYAMEAFAAHFLSDQFAAGHIRTPKEELKEKITPAVLGALLANYMHHEENKFGIQVTNDLGDQWTTYGDQSSFNQFNQTNQHMLLRALQQSADELFDVYQTGVIPEESSVLQLIPHTQSLNNENNLDIAPMFYWDNKSHQLFRRVDLSNPYDQRWTSNWWGWSTLLLLKSQYGITSTIQLSLTRYLSQFAPKELNHCLLG